MKRLFTALAFGLILLIKSGTVQADLVVFNVQVLQSSLALNANLTAPVAVALAEQGPGGLTTTYSGTITVDVNNILNPTSITFLSAQLDANPNGTWQPGVSGVAGSLAADYGVARPEIGGLGAYRDIVFNVSSGATAVAGGNFNVTGQTWSYASGSFFDVTAPGLGAGRADLKLGAPTGLNQGAQGTYAVAGNVITLTLPTNVSINFNDGVAGTNSYTGTIIAIAAVPEPSSMGLVGVATLMGWCWRRRRSKTAA